MCFQIFTKSRFSRNALYLVTIKKHDMCSVGLFHHNKNDTGFLVRIDPGLCFLEVCTVEVKKGGHSVVSCIPHMVQCCLAGLTKEFTITQFVKLADVCYSGKSGGIDYGVKEKLLKSDERFCHVLRQFDLKRNAGELTWRHESTDIDDFSYLLLQLPRTYELLYQLPGFTRT